MRKLEVWSDIANLPVLTAMSVPHTHGNGSGKCATHQTLSASARTYGYRLRVFHDGACLYVLRLPGGK